MRFRTNFRHEQRLPAAAQAQAKHESYFQEYFAWLDAQDGDDPGRRHVTIIARSPESGAIKAMMACAEALKTRRITVQAVLAELEPEQALRQTCDTLFALSRNAELRDILRWAKAPSLKDAHEQCMFGGEISWSGDSMRRRPDQRYGLDLFETQALQTARLGALAFDAIWAVSEPVPGSRLRASANARPHASFANPAGKRLAALSFVNRRDGSNLLRH